MWKWSELKPLRSYLPPSAIIVLCLLQTAVRLPLHKLCSYQVQIHTFEIFILQSFSFLPLLLFPFSLWIQEFRELLTSVMVTALDISSKCLKLTELTCAQWFNKIISVMKAIRKMDVLDFSLEQKLWKGGTQASCFRKSYYYYYYYFYFFCSSCLETRTCGNLDFLLWYCFWGRRVLL